MNDTIYRASDNLCPYCMDEGPFVQQGKSTVVRTGEERTYLECLRCGNTFIKHTKSKHIPIQVRSNEAPAWRNLF